MLTEIGFACYPVFVILSWFFSVIGMAFFLSSDDEADAVHWTQTDSKKAKP